MICISRTAGIGWAILAAFVLGLGFLNGANAQTDSSQANRYLCYVVEGMTGGGHVGGTRLGRDQFGRHKVVMAKPRMICNPVDLSGKVVPKSTVHLECYPVSTEEATKREVVVSSEFEPKQQIVLAQPEMVCVPAKKRFVRIVK